jgi:large subunit ribosomal protein L22
MERPKQTEIKEKQHLMQKQNTKSEGTLQKHEEKTKTEDVKTAINKEDKKKTIHETKAKKTEAVVNGKNIGISAKQAIALCNMIRGKEIDNAIVMIGEVVQMRRAVPMKGEIPHKHGMMSGRYPIKAAGQFMTLLKSLKSNAIANELELEKCVIFAMANNAPRPYKRLGSRFKRAHVTLKLMPLKNKSMKNKI